MIIQAHWGIERLPFYAENIELLPQQQEIFDTLKVHCQQGGLCLIAGAPGTGKSILKQYLIQCDPKRMIVPAVARTLHTYSNTIRILCQAFNIDFDGGTHKCEKRIIEEAFKLNRQGKMIVPTIDDAHLMETECLRRIRLLCEDFPKNHNLVLIGQEELLRKISMTVNEDIKSRITFSATMPKLADDDMLNFLATQLENAKIAANVFTDDALHLIVRAAEGVLRKTKNLTISAMIEAVRDHSRTVDIKHVNHALRQPHWRQNNEMEQK